MVPSVRACVRLRLRACGRGPEPCACLRKPTPARMNQAHAIRWPAKTKVRSPHTPEPCACLARPGWPRNRPCRDFRASRLGRDPARRLEIPSIRDAGRGVDPGPGVCVGGWGDPGATQGRRACVCVCMRARACVCVCVGRPRVDAAALWSWATDGRGGSAATPDAAAANKDC